MSNAEHLKALLAAEIHEGVFSEIAHRGNRRVFNRGGILKDLGKLENIIEAILGKIDLPPKDEAMQLLDAALKKLWAAVDVPGPDLIIEPIAHQILMTLASRAYDRFAAES